MIKIINNVRDCQHSRWVLEKTIEYVSIILKKEKKGNIYLWRKRL